MKKILVTGGAGFIGSHTIVDLIQNGFEVISIDNFSRSTKISLEGIKKITGVDVKNYEVDLCDAASTKKVFEENKNIVGIIHFAAYKAVGESVEFPNLYYKNNLSALTNLLECVDEFNIPHFIFSSSCTVYGEPDSSPIDEDAPLKYAESPYGATKQMSERILLDVSIATQLRVIFLRYFNPAGAHESGLLGELPVGKPQNLVPAITQFAIGKIQQLKVNGNDYPTRDGSNVRDYIHIMDLARAHTLALKFLLEKKYETLLTTFNLGTGNGTTVLEAIAAFEKVTDKKLNYEIGPRRDGDVVAAYADNTKAKNELGWIPEKNIEDIMKDAWQWEKNLNKE